MPFNRIFGDITEFKGDAILNSLGTNTKKYGKICRNVINGINDEKIKDFIDKKETLEPLTIFDTASGDLPCKRVIHVVTSYKKDDPDNSKLFQCYKKAIDYAVENKWGSIAIPLIGTGSNGYSKYDSYEALRKAAKTITIKEDKCDVKIIDINLCVFLSKIPSSREEYRRYNELEDNFELYKCCKVFSRVHHDESINVDLKEFYDTSVERKNNPYYFYLFLLHKKGLDPVETLSGDCTKEQRHGLSKVKRLNNKDIIQLAAIANLTRSETLELMAYNGTSFSPTSILDMAFVNCRVAQACGRLCVRSLCRGWRGRRARGHRSWYTPRVGGIQ